MKRILYTLILPAIILIGCSEPDAGNTITRGEVPLPSTENTVLVYLGIDNDFSVDTDYHQKVQAMKNSFSPSHDGNVAVYCDSGNGDPVLVHIYRDTNGLNQADTIISYKTAHNSASPALLRSVMEDVRDRFPAKKYGLVMLSHASGWLPQGTLAAPRSIVIDWNEQDRSQVSNEMEIWDLAEALPYDLEYLVFDACFMGSVEVAYELKDRVKYVLGSPAEVLVPGFVYTTMMNHLLKPDPDVVGVAEDFYNNYNSKSGYYKSATVSVVETAKLDGLVPVAREILTGTDGENVVDLSKLQSYYPRYLFYIDLEDYIANVSPGKCDEFAARLNDCILYKANTPSYYSNGNRSLNPIETFSGLSIYVPQERFAYINSQYKKTKWAQAVDTYVP